MVHETRPLLRHRHADRQSGSMNRFGRFITPKDSPWPDALVRANIRDRLYLSPSRHSPGRSRRASPNCAQTRFHVGGQYALISPKVDARDKSYIPNTHEFTEGIGTGPPPAVQCKTRTRILLITDGLRRFTKVPSLLTLPAQRTHLPAHLGRSAPSPMMHHHQHFMLGTR